MASMIRPLRPESEAEIQHVARNMRATMIEVLGKAEGEAIYTLEWLEDRVRFHLDPKRSEGEVLLAEADSKILGHTILRVEEDSKWPRLGLFSTLFVEPSWRRQGFAQELVFAGEAWLLARRVDRLATNTGIHNTRLIRLFEKLGYQIAFESGRMVRLERAPEEARDKEG